MPLETCLQAVSEQSEKLHVKSLGMALRSRIQEGYTLSDSLREHPRVFDPLFCSMVAAGEKSGHLDVVLNRLADYTEQRQRLIVKQCHYASMVTRRTSSREVSPASTFSMPLLRIPAECCRT